MKVRLLDREARNAIDQLTPQQRAHVERLLAEHPRLRNAGESRLWRCNSCRCTFVVSDSYVQTHHDAWASPLASRGGA